MSTNGGFSGAIKLAEMNDYLAPNQSCIKPLLKPKSKAGAAEVEEVAKPNTGTRMKVELEFNASDAADMRFPGLQSASSSASALPASIVPGGHFSQIKTDPLKKTASVSLNDCLACSGCVTSAETVLITQQSTQELLNVLEANAAVAASMGDDPTAAAAAVAVSASPASAASSDVIVSPVPVPVHRTVVVSISPQSLVALAHEWGLTALQCAKRLNTFFTRQLGCAAFIDTTPALDIALMEAREEFIARFKHAQDKIGGNSVSASSSSVAASAAAAAAPSNTISPSAASPLPILASECPGWICYCEKTQSVDVLSHVSSVKSAQAILGTILKQQWAPAQSPPMRAEQLFHTTIMPCYDKKLEASRDDFFLQQFATRETDCVLTTGEVQQLLKDRDVDLKATAESDLDPAWWQTAGDTLVRSVDVGGSGGYAEYLFRYAADRLFRVSYAAGSALPYKAAASRNPDFRELSLELQGTTVLSFLLAYGFRNIQNLVRKMKTKKAGSVRAAVQDEVEGVVAAASSVPAASASASASSPSVLLPTGSGGYHFVEVMACPSGCLNGGGQIKAASISAQKALIADLDRAYHDPSQWSERPPESNPIVQRIYASEWMGGNATPYSDAARRLLHTQYHAVEKELVNPLGIKW